MGCVSCTNVKNKEEFNETSPINEQRFNISSLIPTTSGSLLTDYTIIRLIGEGSFGIVREVKENSTDIYRAAKTLQIKDFNPGYIRAILDEIEILKKLDHPGIIKIFQVYKEIYSIHIITELCTGGELFEKIIKNKRFSENTAARYAFDIVSIIKYCHDLGVIHRDLKPENILFEDASPDSRLKIVDFGTSVRYQKNEKLSKIIV